MKQAHKRKRRTLLPFFVWFTHWGVPIIFSLFVLVYFTVGLIIKGEN